MGQLANTRLPVCCLPAQYFSTSVCSAFDPDVPQAARNDDTQAPPATAPPSRKASRREKRDWVSPRCNAGSMPPPAPIGSLSLLVIDRPFRRGLSADRCRVRRLGLGAVVLMKQV